MQTKRKRVKQSSALNRSVTAEAEDRLSILPEDLRRHILSMLPIQDAIRTCILSRKWRSTCWSLPNLTFDYKQFTAVERKQDRFVEFVDQTLSHHDDSDIETFNLQPWRENKAYSGVEIRWITFAVQHNVRDFTLIEILVELERLPCCLFASKSLTKLTLQLVNHVLKLPTSIALPNLKKLSLSVILTDIDLTRNFFSSCPALKYLLLYKCDLSSLKILDVSALKLETLFMYKCDGLNECEINLHTPTLELLGFTGNTAQDYKFRNCSSIYRAYILFQGLYPDYRSKDEVSHSAFKVLRGLCSVTKLLIDEWFIEFLFSNARDPLMYVNAVRFDNLTDIELFIWPAKEQVQKIIIFLSRLPRIRNMYIKILTEEGPPDMFDFEWNSENLVTIGMLNTLTNVSIRGFVGQERELSLVKFLLENAKALVKMTLSASPDIGGLGRQKPIKVTDGVKTVISEKVLAFSRASTKVEILFL